MPENMEATNMPPARVYNTPDNLVQEYVRDVVSTPYITSKTNEEDEGIGMY